MSASKRGRHRAHVSPPARAGNDQLLGQVEQGSTFQAVGRAGAEALRQRLAPGRNGPAEGRKTKWGGRSSRRERQGGGGRVVGEGYMTIWELFNYKPPPSVVERSGGRQTEVWEGGGGGRGSSPPASDSHAILPRKEGRFGRQRAMGGQRVAGKLAGRPCSVESLQVLKDAFRNRLARLADFSLAATCFSCLFSFPSSFLLRGSERKGGPSRASRVLPLSLFARCCFPVVAQMRKQRR
uniref:uncharacterized protein LOC132690091 n=1 Tax=Panthera onca TaxID=9690 RepID=UPI002954CE6F|nr:uncharacterized protein LOC132690091 [Panthera onca]